MSERPDVGEYLESMSRIEKSVREFQRGERQTENYEVLFREYAPKLRGFLFRRGWRSTDLEDLVQEVMINVYKGLADFRLESSFETWLLRIADRADQSARRAQNAGKVRIISDSLEEMTSSSQGASESAHPAPDPLELALSAERRERLMSALNQLPTRTRQCLLFRYQGYSNREIAKAQGVSVETVKKQVTKGSRRLRPILGSFIELFGLFIPIFWN